MTPERTTADRPRVTCVGLVTLDHQQVISRLPGRNEKTVATSSRLTFGGPAANAAATSALLGAATTLVTACGRGPVGRLVLEEIAQAGVRLLDLATSDEPGPAISSVLIDAESGDRAVVSTNAVGVRIDPDSARPGVAGAGCLLVDGHHGPAALAAAQEARRHAIPVVLDGGSWKDGPAGTTALLPLVDIAVLSAAFRVPDGTEPSRYALDAGCAVAAVSRGSQPLLLRVAGAAPVEIPVPPADVVDTVGAGDVLHGAVAYALAAGADPVADARDVLAAATTISSLSCAHAGARGWGEDPRALARARALAATMGHISAAPRPPQV